MSYPQVRSFREIKGARDIKPSDVQHQNTDQHSQHQYKDRRAKLRLPSSQAA